MRTTINIKDGFAEFEFGRVPLTEIGLVGDFGLVRADVALDYYLHYSSQERNGSCWPDKCNICTAQKTTTNAAEA